MTASFRAADKLSVGALLVGAVLMFGSLAGPWIKYDWTHHTDDPSSPLVVIAVLGAFVLGAIAVRIANKGRAIVAYGLGTLASGGAVVVTGVWLSSNAKAGIGGLYDPTSFQPRLALAGAAIAVTGAAVGLFTALRSEQGSTQIERAITPSFSPTQETASALRDAPAPGGSPISSVAQELEKLGKLRADGVITDEEFATAKAKIL